MASTDGPIRAVTVARVSTGNQAGEERYSLPVQQRELREHCRSQGWSIVGEFCEAGTSARTPDLWRLPEFERAVMEIENGHAERLVYHDASRLSRSTELASQIKRRVEAVGGRVVNVQTGMDYSTPEGQTFFNIEAAFSEFTSSKISAHSQKGKRGQFERGVQVGQFPWPYRRGETRSSAPIVDPKEAQILKDIFEAFAMGVGARAISRDLTKRGVRPPGGTGRWIPQTLLGMRSNRFYLGEVEHLGQQRPGIHEPLVDEELFLAVQKPKDRRSRSVQPPLMLQGVARCVEDHRLYPHRPRKGKAFPGERYAYYREPSKDFNVRCSRAGKSILAERVDVPVESLLRALAVDDAWLKHVEVEARNVPVDSTHARRKSLLSKRKRILNAWLEGQLDDEHDYRERLAVVDGELRMLPAEPDRLLIAQGRLTSFSELFDGASAEFRNEVCQLVFASVTVDIEEPVISVEPQPEFAQLLDLRRLYVSAIQPGRG